jgi:hypothetical protein
MQEREDASAELQWICRSALHALSPTFRDVELDACFFHYIGLTHTIRRKGKKWVIRISDHCKLAPAQVIESIIAILGHKVLRKKPPRRSLEIYDGFRKIPSIESAVQRRRLLKGRKHFASETGKHHSPGAIYRELNSSHFDNQIEIQKIGWGRRNSWSRLGHYDPLHQTITLSPVLDSLRVPDFVVRCLVYHEMLHAVFQDKHRHHPPEFRRAERAYPDFARTKKFLREFCARRRK